LHVTVTGNRRRSAGVRRCVCSGKTPPNGAFQIHRISCRGSLTLGTECAAWQASMQARQSPCRAHRSRSMTNPNRGTGRLGARRDSVASITCAAAQTAAPITEAPVPARRARRVKSCFIGVLRPPKQEACLQQCHGNKLILLTLIHAGTGNGSNPSYTLAVGHHIQRYVDRLRCRVVKGPRTSPPRRRARGCGGGSSSPSYLLNLRHARWPVHTNAIRRPHHEAARPRL